MLPDGLPLGPPPALIPAPVKRTRRKRSKAVRGGRSGGGICAPAFRPHGSWASWPSSRAPPPPAGPAAQ